MARQIVPELSNLTPLLRCIVLVGEPALWRRPGLTDERRHGHHDRG
jgi:hypothetical protein